jgi:hypothetical protein
MPGPFHFGSVSWPNGPESVLSRLGALTWHEALWEPCFALGVNG